MFVDGDIVFRIGFIIKIFIGMVMMWLVEWGKVDLDLFVCCYIFDFVVVDELVSVMVIVC